MKNNFYFLLIFIFISSFLAMSCSKDDSVSCDETFIQLITEATGNNFETSCDFKSSVDTAVDYYRNNLECLSEETVSEYSDTIGAYEAEASGIEC